MKKFLSLLALIALLCGIAAAGTEGDRAKLEDRLDDAATILNEIMAAPDKGIPEEVLDRAQCVAIVPSLLKAGLGFGGQYGQGVVTCRTEAGWSAPAFYRLRGGSFGLQIGGQAVDLVMLFMNDRGMRSLLTHKLKLGVDASAAAGPVGRHVSADTDLVLRSEVLTYSRTRGLFAGITLNGSWVEQNDGDTRDFYGRYTPFQTILKGKIPTPAPAQNFVSTVARYAGQPNASAAGTARPVTPGTSTQSSTPTRSTMPSQSTPPGQSATPVQNQAPASSQSQPQNQTPNQTSTQNQAPNQNQTSSQPQGQNSEAAPVPK